jgi:hypothetical protein
VTGITHAIIGAGVGALCKSRFSAFTAGVLSHIAADILPHKDLDPKIEVPLLAGSLALLAKRYGVNSRQFAGALGAVLPDSEHGLMVLGLIDEEDEIFPTHIDQGKYHGPDSGERLSQVIIAAAAIIAAERHR